MFIPYCEHSLMKGKIWLLTAKQLCVTPVAHRRVLLDCPDDETTPNKTAAVAVASIMHMCAQPTSLVLAGCFVRVLQVCNVLPNIPHLDDFDTASMWQCRINETTGCVHMCSRGWPVTRLQYAHVACICTHLCNLPGSTAISCSRIGLVLTLFFHTCFSFR